MTDKLRLHFYVKDFVFLNELITNFLYLVK